MTPCDGTTASHWSVIVIGGGPAGCAAAIPLARAGHRVLLVERANDDGPRMRGGGKVCGGCLNTASIRELGRLGIEEDELRRLGRPLHHVRLVAGGRTASLPMGGSIAVGRDDLDPRLRCAARSAGVVVRQGVSAAIDAPGSSEAPATMELRPTNGDAAVAHTADWVVAADGLGATALRSLPATVRARRRDLPGTRIGVGAILDWPASRDAPRTGELMMIHGDRGYAGLVRLDGERADLAAAVAPAAIAEAGGAGPWLARTLEAAGLPGNPGHQPATRVHGTPRLATRAARAVYGRVLRAGDGLAYAEPFSGQGIAWALESGRRAGTLLATAAGEPLAARSHARVIRAWVRDARGQRRRQRGCRMVAGGLRIPVGAPLLTGLAALVPAVARVGMRMIDRAPRAKRRHSVGRPEMQT